jgi:hypothetical protein
MMQDDLREDYNAAAEMLLRMMDSRDKHESAPMECNAEPLCVGPIAGVELGVVLRESPQTAATLILTAVGEMCRMRRELGAALEWKRDLLAQLEHSADAAEHERREAQAQIQSLGAVVGELQGRLTAWQDEAEETG